MLGLPILDVAIGLVFFYLLLSLACSAAREMLAGLWDSRAKNLKIGIANLLGERDFAKTKKESKNPYNNPVNDKTGNILSEFYAHPLVAALKEDGTKPSYLPANVFSEVMIDLFAPADGTTLRSKNDFVNGVKAALPGNGPLKRTLLIMSTDAADAAELRKKLEEWFNGAMERVSGWYKNKSQWLILAFAFLFSLAINADTVNIAKSLYTSTSMRDAVVAQAQSYAASHQAVAAPSSAAAPAGDSGTALKEKLDLINTLGLPLGWGPDWKAQWPMSLPGIILTALAVSLGAPFWFDLLNKLVSLRSVGKPPVKETTAAARTSPAPAQAAVSIMPGAKG